MPSSKSRQRELARAKYHRQMARKAASERRRRQIQAGIGAGLAVVLIAVGAIWLLGGFDRKKPTASDTCFWTPKNPADNTNLKDVGTPPTSGMPTAGTRTLNITFPDGLVTAELDLAKAPCTSASMAFLAGKNFFDNTKCHRLLDSGAHVLQCGDPSGTGKGGPTYTFTDENLPVVDTTPTAQPSGAASSSPSASQASQYVYPKGTLAMANSGPDTNGSQFFIVYKDSPFPPSYTIFGRVTAGLDVIEKIAARGTVDNGQGAKDKPKEDVVIQSLTVGEVQTPAPTTAPPPSAAATPTPSATPKS